MPYSWTQQYTPVFESLPLSALVAALPLFVLLGSMTLFKARAHVAAVLGLTTAVLVAMFVYGMPARMAAAAAFYGAAFGLLPIGWIVLCAIFVYDIAVTTGTFAIVRESIASFAEDRRIQVLLIAFCFGAFIEGAAGFGTPVAISAAILIGIGFKPLPAAGLALLGNTVPVAYAAMGTPIIALSAVTGLPVLQLSATVGRQLPFFCLIIPFWIVSATAGFRRMLEVWPACLVAGTSFAATQFLVSNYHGPWMVGIASSTVSLLALVTLLKFWRPKRVWRFPHDTPGSADPRIGTPGSGTPGSRQGTAWHPDVRNPCRVDAVGFALSLCVSLGISGNQSDTGYTCRLDGISGPRSLPGHGRVPHSACGSRTSCRGSGIHIQLALCDRNQRAAGRCHGRVLLETETDGDCQGVWKNRCPPRTFAGDHCSHDGHRVHLPLCRPRCDDRIGLCGDGRGVSLFLPILGWVGVMLTGSDTSSNVLFGNLQQITAERLHISPLVAAAANSSGGVMGKMINAQSIVVAAVATDQVGEEGTILRSVLWHSVALVCLVGILVLLQVYLFPAVS